LWNWAELPEKIDARLRDYARANASLEGMAGLNNKPTPMRTLNQDYLKSPSDCLMFHSLRIKVLSVNGHSD